MFQMTLTGIVDAFNVYELPARDNKPAKQYGILKLRQNKEVHHVQITRQGDITRLSKAHQARVKQDDGTTSLTESDERTCVS